MPMIKGSSKAATEKNFDEFRHGKTYAKTRKKFGEKVARKQMIAALLSNKRKSKKTARKRG
jgi:hypothetical protein